MFEKLKKLFVKQKNNGPIKINTYYPQTFWEVFFRIKKIKEQYTRDKKGLQGEYTSYDELGQLQEKCHYKDGKLDGTYKNYYLGMRIATECSYKNGKPEGSFIRYFSDGRVALKCNYKNGKLDGLYEEFNDNGFQRCKCLYKDGKKITENKLSSKRREINYRLDEVNRRENPTKQRQQRKRELVKTYRIKNPRLNSGR